MHTDLQKTQDLKSLHECAMRSADAAINYARQAGELLLAVKKDIGHGKFTAWVQSLGFMDLRMAQRYMAVASGKPYTIGGRLVKNDAASFLGADDESSSGLWLPTAGYWYIHSTDKVAFWVVPWDKNEDWFHISKFYQTAEVSTDEDDMFEAVSHYVGTLSPIPASMIESRLKFYGLTSPSEVEWIKKKKPGTERPFGEPDGYSDRLIAVGKSHFHEQSINS